jgi:hypothetical protein
VIDSNNVVKSDNKLFFPILQVVVHFRLARMSVYVFYVRTCQLDAIEMALGIVPYRVKHKSLAQKHLNLVVAPILRWQRLQKHNDALTVRIVSNLLKFHR